VSDVVVKQFTFAISSLDEVLVINSHLVTLTDLFISILVNLYLYLHIVYFLDLLFSERERVRCMLLPVRLSSISFVHPTQAIEIFGNVSMPFGTLAICDLSIKILRRSFQGNPSVGELKTIREVAKYSDFGIFDLSNAISRKRCKIGAN